MSRNGPPPTRKGYSIFECSSSLQKAVRRGQEEAAIYWALELDQSGFTEYAFRRLRVIASEDVGLAEPLAALTVRALYDNYADERKRDKQATGGLFLVHAVLILARARKSRIVDHALIAVGNDEEVRPVPDEAKDHHTAAGKRMGRGVEHFYEEASLLADLDTGELSPAPVLEDPYRDRARTVAHAVSRGSSSGRSGPGQLQLDREAER
jgi:replication-associated recombination protein RarA